MIGVETVSPRVSGRNSIELVEDQLVYSRRKGNVTTKSREHFGIKVIGKEGI